MAKKKPGRSRTPTEEEYIAKLRNKYLRIAVSIYPYREEDKLLYDWLLFRRGTLGEPTNHYLRDLVVQDMKLHLNEMLDYKAKRDAVLEELS